MTNRRIAKQVKRQNKVENWNIKVSQIVIVTGIMALHKIA